jgi:hypothetical protein
MFCLPCIIVYQYNETNAMHFSFNLLRIKGLYMFRALLAHPQEARNKRYLVYCVRIMSVKLWPCHSQLTLYARNIPSAVCEAPPEDEQVKLETCRGPWFPINWMKIASRWFYYPVIKEVQTKCSATETGPMSTVKFTRLASPQLTFPALCQAIEGWGDRGMEKVT